MEQTKDRLDKELEVSSWRTPFDPYKTQQSTSPDEVDRRPAWWRGDEEASQSFLAAMGVHLNG